MRAIIPSAGFGTRMNMKPNESKELIHYNGVPLIERTISICKLFDIEPLVITRKEKTDLIAYCEQHNIEYKIIEVKGEWPDTVLASSDSWDESNLLILPDTVFEPIDIIKDIKLSLDLGSQAVFALHNVNNVSKWGSIDKYRLTEKSTDIKSGYAWGLIGFKSYYGTELFKSMKVQNNPFLLRNSNFHYLTNFKDVTRNE